MDDATTPAADLVRPHWHYGYDDAGNRTSQTDPRAQNTQSEETYTTQFEFDQYGNQVRRTLPGGQQETFTYDAYGRQATHVDFNGNTATYSYYPAGHVHAGMLQQVVYVGATGSGKPTQTVNYTYNNLGRIQTVTDASGTTTYTYDVEGNVIQEVTPEGTINYAYDQATGQHTRTWTSNTEIGYGYDDQGRLEHVYVLKLNGTAMATYTGTGWDAATHEPTFTGMPLMTTYAYDPAGNKISEMLPNGILTTYTFDALNRLTDLLQKQGATTLFSQSYILNPDGTRASLSESQRQADGSTVTRSLTWSYDALSRLMGEVLTSSEASQNYSDTFAYDLAGNRLNKTHTGPGGGASEIISYSYNANDQLDSETSSSSGLTEYEYDANGSQTSSTHAGQTTTHAYDVRNKLVSITAGGVTTTYGYDDEGNRISQSSGGSTTLYLTDRANPTGYSQPLEAKPSAQGAPSMTYFLGDRVFGQASGAGVVSYLLTDGHGSTRAVTGSTGNVATTLTYDAFGGELDSREATAGTVFLFGGDAIYDPASGLYFHGNGIRTRSDFRFLQMDSWAGNSQDPLSLHKYLYAGANPVMNADPSGQFIDTLISVGMSAMEYAAQGAAMAAPLMQAAAVAGAVTYLNTSIMLGMMDAGWVSNDMRDKMVELQNVAFWTMVGGTVGYGLCWGVMASAAAMRTALSGPASMNTVHGTQRLLERGFTEADIAATRTGQVLTQSDGAKVFIKEVAPGKFNVIVEGTRGVITALKGISQKALDRLANNYGWHE